MPKAIITILISSLLVLASCATTETKPSTESDFARQSFDSCFEQGISSLRQGDYRGAVVHFERAISLNPNSDKARNLRGVAYLNLKNYPAAMRDFQKAISLNPDYSEAYNNLGGVYFLRQRLEEAEEMFRKALSLAPDSIPTLYSLGTLLILQGRFEEGSRYLARGIDLDPDYLETHKTLTADIRSPASEQSEVCFTYARIYASNGDVEKTLEFLEKAKRAGFTDWQRVSSEKEFEKVRDDPKIKDFLRQE